MVKPFTALVLGDFMLDTYTHGRVKRISPEAPVPILEITSQESRPGGAGNVVLNLIALGGTVHAIGRLGDDDAGRELRSFLEKANASHTLLAEGNYHTAVKNRLVADSQQLLRLDREKISPLSADLEKTILQHLETAIPQVQVVAISDYGKGFLTPRIIARAIQIAKDARIPIIVDPKGSDFTKYKGATLIKPNLSEAYTAAKASPDASLDTVAKTLLEISQATLLLITRSEAGMSLFDNQGNRHDFPVRAKQVKDVTGAGDTVLAVFCLGLANQMDIHETSHLANVAASISIERLGCVQITLDEIMQMC